MARSQARWMAAVWMAVALATAAGCARGTRASSVANGGAEGETVTKDLQVEVVSHAFRDANVYLHLNGSRRRLGLAGGNKTSVFEVPWNAQISNTVLAHLTAEIVGDDSSVESSSIQVAAGARVVWTLNGSFVETSLEVY
jgi:hypothetical protein